MGATEKLQKVMTSISASLDIFARFIVVLITLIVVSNVILRFFGKPMQGAYEWVGIFTALATAMALAFCSVQSGHVAVSLLVDRLKPGLRLFINTLSSLIVLVFLVFTFRAVFSYAATLQRTGEVSLATGIPFYPIVYIIAFGVIIFAAVTLVNLVYSLKIGGQE